MIYPNPTTGNITILGTNEGDLFELQSVVGSTVLQQKMEASSAVSIQNLPRGIYFYQIHRDGKAIDTGKLIRD